MNKKHFLVALCLAACLFAHGQSSSKQKKPEDMIRRYWFVLLTTGEHRSQDSITATKIQEGHLANIEKLYGEGKIKVAGPFGEGSEPKTVGWQGLFIFDCESKEEVEKLLKTDPAVAAGRLVFQIIPWYTVPTGSFERGKPKAPLF